MNDRMIHRKSEDFHNRFSCIIASNSSEKTTTRGQGHISSFTPSFRMNQHINQCFLPTNEPHHVRTTRADPQFSIFPSRNFSKSGIHLFSPRQTMNKYIQCFRDFTSLLVKNLPKVNYRFTLQIEFRIRTFRASSFS